MEKGSDGQDWGTATDIVVARIEAPLLDKVPAPPEPFNLVNYREGITSISGHGPTVVSIHETTMRYKFWETVVLAVLAAVLCVVGAIVVVAAPAGRENTALVIAVSVLFLPAGLSGFAAFKVKVSKTGIDVTGKSAEALKGK